MTTYYEILGVSPDATEDEIERAYQERVKDTHPDHNDDPNAAQQFMQVQEAYQILGNEEQRRRYDEQGHDEYIQGGAKNGESSTSEDLYSEGLQTATRGTAAAEYIWDRKTNRTAKPDPSPDTEDKPLNRRLITYSIVTLPVWLTWFTFSFGLLPTEDPPFQEAVIETAPLWSLIFIAVAVTVVCIIAGEAILGTKRRIVPN